MAERSARGRGPSHRGVGRRNPCLNADYTTISSVTRTRDARSWPSPAARSTPVDDAAIHRGEDDGRVGELVGRGLQGVDGEGGEVGAHARGDAPRARGFAGRPGG